MFLVKMCAKIKKIRISKSICRSPWRHWLQGDVSLLPPCLFSIDESKWSAFFAFANIFEQ